MSKLLTFNEPLSPEDSDKLTELYHQYEERAKREDERLASEVGFHYFHDNSDEGYCGACMESPCMCSDKEQTSMTHGF